MPAGAAVRSGAVPAVETVTLHHGSATVPTLVYDPGLGRPGPAVVLSTEAFGINRFTRDVAQRLAEAGYVVVVPDYYRGHGLSDPENYTDFTEVMQYVEALDFTAGTRDILAGVDHARRLSGVDPERVAVWGYCTGGTLALLAAALDRRLAAAVLFFPSQPTFPELNEKRPVQPIDLLWSVACPLLLLYGDRDPVWAGVAEETRRRLDQWEVGHEIRIYQGAGHAFSAPVPPLRHDAADAASWADALEFLGRHL
jgi:carboxymethylenebutenolidase